jgi:hypothetical protein
MRNMDACLYVGPSDRMTLERLIADGKTPQKIFNATPKPFKWTAKADSILEKNARARQVLV